MSSTSTRILAQRLAASPVSSAVAAMSSLIFSTFANDVPETVRATVAVDAALQMIAEAN